MGIDSTKIVIVSKALDKLAGALSTVKPPPTILDTYGIPFLTLLIGAVLTLFIQSRLENRKNTRDDIIRKRQLIAKAKAKTYLIWELLKDLAMYRVHKQYYRRAAELSTEKVDIDDSYNKHYEKGQETRTCESKFDIAVSEYIEIIMEYLEISTTQKKMEPSFDVLYDYDFPKSSKFDECRNLLELETAMELEELRIKSEYKKYLGQLDSISHHVST